MRFGKVALAALLALAASVFAGAKADEVSFIEDIHFRVGKGDNECAVIFNWNGKALAWSYRWNDGEGEFLADAINAIAEEDPRFTIEDQGGGYGMYLTFAGYDLKDSAAKFDPAKGTSSDPSALAAAGYSVYDPTDPNAYMGMVYYYWNMLVYHGTKYSITDYDYTSGASSEQLHNGSWYTVSFGSEPILSTPEAAETPYAYAVTDRSTEADYPYDDPECVLGRPCEYMDFQWGGVVNPANTAWGKNALFTLSGYKEGDAYVTIKFDHDVVDDAKNPFGADFIVFGNIGFSSSGELYTEGETDPEKFIFGNSLWECTPGRVSVSSDGENWATFDNGPFADCEMPTLGRMYEPTAPDGKLYNGNVYWGKRTKPWFPCDPRVTYESVAGLSLAEVCRRYNGSAGGTSFDLAGLPDGEKANLLRDDEGRLYIRYVRIEAMEVEGLDYAQVTPEVDAVCDVAPVSDYENWVLDNYGWVNVWNGEVTGKDAAATRFEYEYDGNGLAIGVISSAPHISGMSNLACAVLGVDLFEDSGNETLGFKVESFYRDDSGRNTLTLLSHVPLDSSCGIVVKGTSNLADKWRTIPATIESSEYDAERGFVRTTFIAEDDKCRFFKLAIE